MMNALRGKTAVVTGASGYLGRALVARLAGAGVRTRIVTRSSLPAGAAIDVCRVDALRSDALAPVMENADVVFHLVAHAHDLRTNDDTRQQTQVTLGSTLAALRAAEETRVANFVFVSSLAVAGPTGPDPVDEDYPGRPVTPYGKAKLASEDAVRDYASRTGLCASSIRPAMIYGPGAPGNLPRMIDAVRRGVFPPIPEFGNRRSVVGVEDVVTALLLAWAHGVRGGRAYIITDDAPLSTRQMLDAIRCALGQRAPRFTIPAATLSGLAMLGDCGGSLIGRRLPFDSRALSRLTDSAAFSPRRAVREIGFKPTTTLVAALPQLITGVA